MKKVVSILVIFALCLSFVGCIDNRSTEERIQGNWERLEEVTSTVHVSLNINNGAITRTEQNKNNETSTLSGTYTVEKDWISVNYSDGSTQRFRCLGTDSGWILVDADSGVQYVQ